MPQHYQKDVWLFLDRLPYLELHLEPEIVLQDYYQQLVLEFVESRVGVFLQIQTFVSYFD